MSTSKKLIKITAAKNKIAKGVKVVKVPLLTNCWVLGEKHLKRTYTVEGKATNKEMAKLLHEKLLFRKKKLTIKVKKKRIK